MSVPQSTTLESIPLGAWLVIAFCGLLAIVCIGSLFYAIREESA